MVTGQAPFSLIHSYFIVSHGIQLVIAFVSDLTGQLHTLSCQLSHVDSHHVDSCHVDSSFGELQESRLVVAVLSLIELHVATWRQGQLDPGVPPQASVVLCDLFLPPHFLPFLRLITSSLLTLCCLVCSSIWIQSVRIWSRAGHRFLSFLVISVMTSVSHSICQSLHMSFHLLVIPSVSHSIRQSCCGQSVSGKLGSAARAQLPAESCRQSPGRQSSWRAL